MERELVSSFSEDGWNVLNIAPAGGLGGRPDLYWTKDRLQEEVKKYATRSQFKEESGSAYVCAHRQGLIEELFADHPNAGRSTKMRPHGTWTFDALLDEARKFTHRKAMAKDNPAAYQAAHKKGLTDQIFANHPNQGYLNPRRR